MNTFHMENKKYGYEFEANVREWPLSGVLFSSMEKFMINDR